MARGSEQRRQAGAVLDEFIAFVRADTWPATRRYLETHPELVTDDAVEIIRRWVASDDGSADWWNQYHYGLLVGSRLMGIGPMFENLDPSTGPTEGVVAPQRFENDLRRLADLDAAARRQPALHRDRIALMEGVVRRLDQTEASPFRTAMLINIAAAYAQLPTGDRAVNLRNAAASLTEAGQFVTPKTAPPAYAESQRSLGLEYLELPTGDPAANFDKAIGCFEEAVRFYSREYTPKQWALTQSDLGLAFAQRQSADREADLRRAISCFRASLLVFTQDAAPSEYDALQKNLALATKQLERLRGESR